MSALMVVMLLTDLQNNFQDFNQAQNTLAVWSLGQVDSPEVELLQRFFAGLEKTLNSITGVVTNGLFAMKPADILLLGTQEGVKTLTR